jgi:hypothetical protein
VDVIENNAGVFSAANGANSTKNYGKFALIREIRDQEMEPIFPRSRY